MNILEQLLQIASLGYRIFPCHSVDSIDGICTCGKPDCKDIGKHPLCLNGVKDATRNPDIIRGWFGEFEGQSNWAIATGRGVGVVDIDPRHNGEFSWQKLIVEAPTDLEETLSVQTGSGGVHFLF